MTNRLKHIEVELESLYQKQGRNQKFKNQSERDTWLNNEIKSTVATIKTQKAAAKQAQTELNQMEGRMKDIDEVYFYFMESVLNQSKKLWCQSKVIVKNMLPSIMS